jgi:glucose-1-phosphate adenylyltransferase
MDPEVFAFVMAGGSGSRLRPLTDQVCKPAVPFGADHRVVDFVLSNLRNSGVQRVDVLVQHKPRALMSHVQRRWTAPAGERPFAVRLVMPPEQPVGRSGRAGYLGTADAVFQNLAGASLRDDDLVAVFGADHVYRMDLRQMVRQHLEHGADVSVAALPVPLSDAREFGVVEIDAGGRVEAFHEKPRLPAPMPGRPSHALVSMGNYLFNAGVLREALQTCCGAGRYDFGHDVLPYLAQRCQVRAYDFQTNTVPGLGLWEEPAYWRDVGTLDAYFRAQMDTLGPAPRFALDNPQWPLSPTRTDHPPALVMRGETRYSRLGSRSVVDHALLDHAVIGARAQVHAGARLARCVLFESVVVGSGARLHNVVVAEGNTVPSGERIGFDAFEDRERFTVSADGVVVVPPNHFHPGRTLRRAVEFPAQQPAG